MERVDRWDDYLSSMESNQGCQGGTLGLLDMDDMAATQPSTKVRRALDFVMGVAGPSTERVQFGTTMDRTTLAIRQEGTINDMVVLAHLGVILDVRDLGRI